MINMQIFILQFLSSLSAEALSFLLFLTAIVVLIYFDRNNIERQGILILRRTEKGKKLVEDIAKRKMILKPLAKISVIIGIILMIYASFLMFSLFIEVLLGIRKIGAMILAPGPVSEVKILPGVMVVPWYFWVIGIGSVVLFHELSHAIFSRVEGIKVKSFGLLLFLIFPGAFCEPDEKQLKKANTLTKLKVYSSGSFSNIVLAIATIALAFLFFSIFYEPYGVGFVSYLNNSPAKEANLSGTILYINGIRVRTIEELSKVMENIRPGEEIRIETTQGNYSIVTISDINNESRAIIGISNVYTFTKVKEKIQALESILDFIIALFMWIYFLNLNIGIINLLPIKPLDGGLMFYEIIRKFSSKRTAEKVTKITSIFFAFILAFIVLFPVFLAIK
ncbi:MAG: site-2 protease family protein [Candidatus Aenigmatarchaeota archaeon]